MNGGLAIGALMSVIPIAVCIAVGSQANVATTVVAIRAILLTCGLVGASAFAIALRR
jgi:hypothetical protein